MRVGHSKVRVGGTNRCGRKLTLLLSERLDLMPVWGEQLVDYTQHPHSTARLMLPGEVDPSTPLRERDKPAEYHEHPLHGSPNC